jgi:hypothetical protein
MFDTIFLILIGLLVKHWYVDFVNQSDDEIASKGIYGRWTGIKHSLKHGALTVVVLLCFIHDTEVSILLGLVDAIIHYHIDWFKVSVNQRKGWTVKDSGFWLLFGLDQLAHSLTYVLIVWLLF